MEKNGWRREARGPNIKGTLALVGFLACLPCALLSFVAHEPVLGILATVAGVFLLGAAVYNIRRCGRIRADYERRAWEEAENVPRVAVQIPSPPANARPGAEAGLLHERLAFLADRSTPATGTFYRLSGRFGPGGIAAMLAAGGAVALVISPIYGGICWILEQMVQGASLPAALWPLLAAGYGFLIGFAARAGAKAGHVRSQWAARGAGGLAGLFGWYAGTVVFATLMLGHFTTDIEEIVDLMSTDFGMAWLVGLANSVVLVLCAGTMAGRLPVYCEECRCWTHRRPHARFASVTNVEAFAEALARCELTLINQLQPLPPRGATEHIELVVDACPRCSFRVLSVLLFRKTPPQEAKKGRVRTPVVPLVGGLIVDAKAISQVEPLRAGETPAG